MIPSMAIVIGATYQVVYPRDFIWLFFGLFFAAASILWFARARRAGDSEAPPLRSPRAVWRAFTAMVATGLGLLVWLLWRLDGDWQRMSEPGNAILGRFCFILILGAPYIPLEWSRAPAASSD